MHYFMPKNGRCRINLLLFPQYHLLLFNDFRDRTYAMFHSQTSQVIKEHIINPFSNSNGHARILIATIAFGMGVDCKGLKTMVHFDPLQQLRTIIRRRSRVRRNGKQSFAILINSSGCTSMQSVQLCVFSNLHILSLYSAVLTVSSTLLIPLFVYYIHTYIF